jgi:hypothetical protein
MNRTPRFRVKPRKEDKLEEGSRYNKKIKNICNYSASSEMNISGS